MLARILSSRLLWVALAPVVGYISSAGTLMFMSGDRPTESWMVQGIGLLGISLASFCMFLSWLLKKLPQIGTAGGALSTSA